MRQHFSTYLIPIKKNFLLIDTRFFTVSIFIIEAAVGILLICAGLLIRFEYYSNLIFAMGFGISFSSFVQLLRIIYWQQPKRAGEYEAKKQEAYINAVDERKQYLRMQAGYITYQIMTLVLLGLSFVLALFRTSAWVIGMLFLLFVSCWIIGIAVYRVLEKRM